MEERVGERRSLSHESLEPPLSSVLSPLVPRGERKKNRIPNSLSSVREVASS